MALVHGKEITSQEIEQYVSWQFTPARFVSMCNALIWALGAQNCGSLPSFTERVNVPDTGIDAEWETDLQDDANCSTSLLGSGWNIYQSKYRDLSAQDRSKIVSRLTNDLSGAIKTIYERKGRRPNRYILFTNIDLSIDQHASLKAKIVEGYDQPDQVHIEIVGAAEFAVLLNSVPHLRSAYFVPNQFSTWDRYWEQHLREKRPSVVTDLIGREQELSELSACLNDSNIRAILISGPHEIGKTRLALQLTKSHANKTVVSLDPESLTVGDLLALASPRQEVVVLMDDPAPEKADQFVKQGTR